MSVTNSQHKGRCKSEKKCQQMLCAAAELFLTKGFENTSMDQVAVDAGVSKQTVYNHFGSKEALFSAIISSKCEAGNLTDKLFDDDASVIEVLQTLAQRFCELMISDESIAVKRACVAETPQRIKVAKLYWDAGPKQLLENFARYLAEQNARGKTHIDNPSFAAQQFLFMLKGQAHDLKLLGQPYEDLLKEQTNYINSCVKMFKKAYID